jgi:malonyl-CoA decarboxylase
MEDEQSVLLSSADRKILCDHTEAASDSAILADLLGRADWFLDEALAEALKEPMTRLAARYLLNAKGRGGRVQDPVANFHLTNGARMERLNWLGDLSTRGFSQSYGLMINYLYRLGDIETNSIAYLANHEVAESPSIRTSARG